MSPAPHARRPRRPAAVVAVVAGVLALTLAGGALPGPASAVATAPESAADRPAVAAAPVLPAVSLIPGRTMFGAATQNLRRAGYSEREYAVRVTDPHVYAYTGDGTQVTRTPAPAAPQGAYRTRMIVRAPEEPRRFNGRVLVEMMNTTAGLDLDIAWQQAHRSLMRDGWAYVGITVQQTGINALGLFTVQPSRYSRLKLGLVTPAAAPTSGLFGAGARDPSLAWDLVSQVGALMSSRSAANPLRSLRPRTVLLTGQSQMAGYAVTYINAIHPLAGVYDGFLVASRSARATNLGFSPTPTSTSDAQVRIDGRGTPVLNLQTETDLTPSPLVRRGDADTATDRFRLWEVAGSAHNDEWVSLQAIERIERDLPIAPPAPCPWVPPARVSDFPVRYAWNAALAGLARWAEGGGAPPTAPLVSLDDTGAVVRDADQNAVGGLRLPALDVPVRTYTPTAPPQPSAGALDFCRLTGTETPFDRATLRQRYPSTSEYVDQVRAAARADRRAGVLLAADAREILRAAARGPVTWGGGAR